MAYFHVGVILVMLFLTVTNSHILPDKPEEKPEVKLDTDTKVNDNGGTRIISELEIYPGGRGSGEPGPPGPVGPQGPAGLQGPPGPSSGGASYIRWGRTTCPDIEGTELLYSGRAAGAHYTHKGSGGNYLCLTDEPEFLEVTAGEQTHRSLLYGAEYQTSQVPPAFSDMSNHNVPCAACYTSVRGGKIMIPGTIVCPSSWTREYYGYIMANYYGHHRTTFECVDVDAESIPGSAANTDGTLFYFTEMRDCAGINCPPYTSGVELTCAVCTK